MDAAPTAQMWDVLLSSYTVKYVWSVLHVVLFKPKGLFNMTELFNMNEYISIFII